MQQGETRVHNLYFTEPAHTDPVLCVRPITVIVFSYNRACQLHVFPVLLKNIITAIKTREFTHDDV